MSDAIYISSTQQTFKKIMDSHFSNLQRLVKNGQKSDSFAAHSEQHVNTTTSCIDLRKYMTVKVLKQLNPIGAMKTFTKHNFNLCMEERLTILKNIRDKRVTVINKNSEIYRASRHNMTFHEFCLSTNDSVFNRWKVGPLKEFSNLINWNFQQLFLNTENFLK